MSHVKQAGKRTRTDPNTPQPPPCLSQTPVERWFVEDDERTAYDERLSKIEILPPKYIGDGVLPDVKYPKLWRLIDIQGLRPFLYMRGSLGILGSWFDLKTYMYIGLYYPHFVAAAFTTIFICGDSDSDEGDGFALGFRHGYKFTLAALATSWGLKNEGDIFKGGSYLLGSWDEFSKATAMRDLRLDYATSGKYAVSRMSTDHRLLLYVLSYVLLPRKSNHGTATEENLLILWAIMNEKQIHWPYLMAHRLFRYSQGRYAGSFLGLVHLWTGIFDMAPLDLSCEEVVPTETEVPSQEQSEVIEFVRKGFEDMRMMISEGFTRLSERIDGLDTHMTSQDVDIRSLRDEFRSFKGEDVAFDPPEHQDDAPAQD
ncbi:hypothetical protein PIB30_078427 [Stylosanthes scabra]|uniref:Aminotransferase-like plant mobile domain-containing protein n=1 Tax=Stylosanthes scabra TaxID=79078 RepID=A0ABU6SSZ4_9FABA|nr:hypothetical protein [Stylosanthes scabra]